MDLHKELIIVGFHGVIGQQETYGFHSIIQQFHTLVKTNGVQIKGMQDTRRRGIGLPFPLYFQVIAGILLSPDISHVREHVRRIGRRQKRQLFAFSIRGGQCHHRIHHQDIIDNIIHVYVLEKRDTPAQHHHGGLTIFYIPFHHQFGLIIGQIDLNFRLAGRTTQEQQCAHRKYPKYLFHLLDFKIPGYGRHDRHQTHLIGLCFHLKSAL